VVLKYFLIIEHKIISRKAEVIILKAMQIKIITNVISIIIITTITGVIIKIVNLIRTNPTNSILAYECI
jgi:hypothetical protein